MSAEGGCSLNRFFTSNCSLVTILHPSTHPSTHQPYIARSPSAYSSEASCSLIPLIHYLPVIANFSCTGTLLLRQHLPTYRACCCLHLLLPPPQLPTTTNYYSCPPNSRHSIHFLFFTSKCQPSLTFYLLSP